MEANDTGWYEDRQNHNAITRWLHSFRYQHAIRVVTDLHHRLGRPVRIVDVGCCMGKLFDVLHFRVPIQYRGIELDKDFADVAHKRHFRYKNFSIAHGSALTELEKCDSPDIVMALETLEHIPEADVVRLIEQVARLRVPLFATVPVEIGPAIWLKNVGSLVCGYLRHKEYTWAETLWAGLYQLDRLPPHGTLHKGFDWRWLAQTIRHNMRVKTHHFPLSFMPAAVSSSVCFIAEPRIIS